MKQRPSNFSTGKLWQDLSRFIDNEDNRFIPD